MPDLKTSIKNILLVILVLASIILTAVLISQQSNLARIREENKALREKTATLPELSTKPSVVQDAPEAEAAVPSNKITATPVERPPSPPAPNLTFDTSTVSSSNGVLKATLSFKPSNDTPQGELFVVARLPKGHEYSILGIHIIKPEAYIDLGKRITDDGKFAAFRTQTESAAEVEFSIEVSGPSILDVRGTCGIGPFDLNITPEQASVTPK